MQSALDQAITAASTAEATYTADVNNVASIQSSIATATAPLAPAQTQLTTDTEAYVTALNALSAAALAQVTSLSAPATTQNPTAPTTGS